MQEEDAQILLSGQLVKNRTNTASALLAAFTTLTLGILLYVGFSPVPSTNLIYWIRSIGFSLSLTVYVITPAIMILRAIIVVESVGYMYHRFFQHLNFMTRVSKVFKRNQKFHWVHHMVIYHIGPKYKRDHKYIRSEKYPWSWAVPFMLGFLGLLLLNGINHETAAFLFGLVIYGYIIHTTHSRFHVEKHPWTKSPYFQYLEEVHLLHHYDQKVNFTITNPIMDKLFGTYCAPHLHQKELQIAKDAVKLTPSDVTNYSYLLDETKDAKDAVAISAIRENPKSLTFVAELLYVFAHAINSKPKNKIIKQRYQKTIEYLKEIGTQQSKKIIQEFENT